MACTAAGGTYLGTTGALAGADAAAGAGSTAARGATGALAADALAAGALAADAGDAGTEASARATAASGSGVVAMSLGDHVICDTCRRCPMGMELRPIWVARMSSGLGYCPSNQ